MIDRDTLAQLRQLLRPIAVRVANTVARGLVQLVDDGTKMQLVQLGVLAGETVDGAEYCQPYGLSSVPLAGAEGVVLFPNGDRSHPLVVTVADRRYRPTGSQPGEVVLYTDEGDEVRLARGNQVVLSTSGDVLLGGAAAGHGVIRGTQRNNAEQAFLTAMNAFVAAVVPTTGAPAPAIAAFTTAIAAFKSAVAAAISDKVWIE